MRSTRVRGFTLIELILISAVVSIGLVGLTRLLSYSTVSLSRNEIQQQATQYAQECIEKALAIRRHDPGSSANDGFDWFATNTFSCGTAPAGFSYNAAPAGALFTGTDTAGACPPPPVTTPPTTNNCRLISVTVTSTSDATISSSASVLLVKAYQ